MPVTIDFDVMPARRKMSMGELADRAGITPLMRLEAADTVGG